MLLPQVTIQIGINDNDVNPSLRRIPGLTPVGDTQ